jgi:hypothetical protein
MYLVSFGFLKSLELTNDHFGIWKFEKKTLIWGPPYDATIDINNVLFHHMIQQKNNLMFCFKFNKILTIELEKSKMN